jgi:DNA-binding Lrp family transcriptional regulator
MPKSSLKAIEKDQKKIIDELKKNANKSINDIAKKCKFSRQKVWRYVKDLEKNHTIWGYSTIIDEEKLNRKSYIMLIKRSNKPIEKEEVEKVINRDIEKDINKIGIELVSSIYTNGIYDWVIIFNAPDIVIAKNFVEYFNKLYSEIASRVDLIENMFFAVNCGIKNPEIEKLRNYFNF